MAQTLARFNDWPGDTPLYPAGQLPLGVSVFADRTSLRAQIGEDAAASGFRLGAHGPLTCSRARSFHSAR